ncbi:MAG: flagellar hook protein FlgE [Bradyrhizobium sp.]|jgi:flagellar hook protein FlgE|nr:flagellar hook protein FlgE [Bradyrhizobium sp.]
MSLTGALSSAVSALNAQSQSLAMISDNISNADTVGYKTTSAMFEDMVTASSTLSSYSSGGVSVNGRANITQQGLLAATANPTDVAIKGAGFFVTKDASGNTFYTRNGAFVPDKNGMLENNGFFLEGWRTDASGNIVGDPSPAGLTNINTEVAATSAAASTKSTIAANLPADAAPGSTFTSSMTVTDSLGTQSSVQITWTKDSTVANQWTATFGDPTSASDSTVKTGTTTTPATVTINFNSDGSLASTTPASPTLSITGWTDGAANMQAGAAATDPSTAIALNFGTPGKTDGLSQLASGASGDTAPTITNATINTDGLPFGTLSSISIATDGSGTVEATYSNGQTIPIYKIAVATFNDPNGLAAQSDGMYTSTQASGNASVEISGTNGAGTIFGSELESSTTDTSGQFSNMISAQQAYSAASQVITTVNKMFDTLISAVSR